MKQIRLFISSTFGDFTLERNALQSKVFPVLSKLCSKEGFGFMPIDLRWGVNQEAQLDQSTMDLCLSEVKACKADPHPDFLVLLGDRYGWVPIPYRIEQSEFEQIQEYIIESENQQILNKWYKLDLNEIPASYILQKRIGKYEIYENWASEENALRDILQQAVTKTSLPDIIKEKYSTSATEFEYQEYIQGFGENKPSSLFVIDRNITNVTEVPSKKYFDDNADRLISFTNKIQEKSQDDNYIQLETTLVSEKTISDEHIQGFISQVTEKLSASIEQEIKRIKNLDQASEQQYHTRHKNTIVEDLVGRDSEVEDIFNYANSNSNQPYVLYGPSGMGKSSIMAEAIKQSENALLARVVYRFCGIAPQSSDTKSLWSSILDQLGISIQTTYGNEQELTISNLHNNEGDMNRFEFQIASVLNNITEPTIIYLDALDQLGDQSKCGWLPNSLPENLKIVISVLNDKNYKDDSYYYEKLSTIIPQESFHELKPLENTQDAKTILQNILKQYNRTLTDGQYEKVQELYKSVQSPLYLQIIAQELRHYPSDQDTIELATTQKESITEFMDNLSKLYHHEPMLIEKVFGYIIASQNSTNESLLYEVLSNNQELVNQVENSFHANLTNKLPTAVWSRLHYQIKPFIKEDTDDNIHFFHREFHDGAKRYLYKDSQREQINIDFFQELLQILQNMLDNPIYKEQKEHISKAYLETLVHQKYLNENSCIEKQVEYFVKKEQIDKDWFKSINNFFNNKIQEIGYVVNYNLFSAYTQTWYEILENFYIDKYSTKWAEYYLISSQLLSFIKSINNIDLALEIGKKGLKVQESLCLDSNLNFIDSYLLALTNMSKILLKAGRISDAIIFQKKAIQLLADSNLKNMKSYSVLSMRTVATSLEIYSQVNFIDNDIKLEIMKIKILVRSCRQFYNEIPHLLKHLYLEILSHLVTLNKNIKDYDEAFEAEHEMLEISQKLYANNKNNGFEYYFLSLYNLADSYKHKHNIDEALRFIQKAIEIIQIPYENNNEIWGDKYVGSLVLLYRLLLEKNELTKAEEVLLKVYSITKSMYAKNQLVWCDIYLEVLLDYLSYEATAHLDNHAADIEKKLLSLSNASDWNENSALELVNYIVSSRNNNSIEELAIETISVAEVFFDKYRESKGEKYFDSIIRVIQVLNKTDKYTIAIEISKKPLEILNNLYVNSKIRWARHYSEVVHHLVASNYGKATINCGIQNLNLNDGLDLKNLNNALDLAKFAYDISLENFGEEDALTKQYYDDYLQAKCDTKTQLNTIESYDEGFDIILLLAKGVAIVNEKTLITISDLYSALYFVKLNSYACGLFTKLFGEEPMDNLKEINQGNELLKISKDSAQVPYDLDLKSKVDTLQGIFGSEKICILRS